MIVNLLSDKQRESLVLSFLNYLIFHFYLIILNNLSFVDDGTSSKLLDRLKDTEASEMLFWRQLDIFSDIKSQESGTETLLELCL